MSVVPGLVWLQAVWLQAQPPRGTPVQDMLILMGLLFAIFYFLVIRPQTRRQRQHDEMLKSISRGDTVVTAGGIHGKVTGAAEDVLTIEVAALRGERVRVRVDRAKVERRIEAARRDKDKDKEKEKDKEKGAKEGPAKGGTP